MKKVLVLNTIGMGYEGISSVIINYLTNMDRTNLSYIKNCYDDMPKTELKQIMF